MNEFKKDLEYSHTEADKDYWLNIYKRVFPTLERVIDNREDNPEQRAGVDKIIVLKGGKKVTVDEKIRRVCNTGDIMLEYQSSPGKAGWVEKPLLCDYIVYIFSPSGTAHILPVNQLQAAWLKHKAEWINKYRTRSAINEGYNTLSCPVPTHILLQAIMAEYTVQYVECQERQVNIASFSHFSELKEKCRRMRE
jgi:hypothetical protein